VQAARAATKQSRRSRAPEIRSIASLADVISIVEAVVSAAIVVFGVTQFIVGGVWDLLRHIFIDSGRP
jgi:hypothetical protein